MTDLILDIEQHTPHHERALDLKSIVKAAVISELKSNSGVLQNAIYSYLRSNAGRADFVEATQSILREELLANNSELLQHVKAGVAKELQTIQTELLSNKYINSYLASGLTDIVRTEFSKHDTVFKSICEDAVLKEAVKEKAIERLNCILDDVVRDAFYCKYND